MSTAATAAKTIPSTERLVAEHLWLVHVIARHMSNGSITELEERVQDGVVGLIDAASKYRERQGVPFKYYAHHRIRGAIRDGQRVHDWASRYDRGRFKRLEQAADKLRARLGREPQEEEMAAELGKSIGKYRKMAGETMPLEKGGAAFVQLEETWLGDQQALRCPALMPDQLCLNAEQRKLLAKAIKCLPKRWQYLVMRHYFQDVELQYIAPELKVNNSRASQIRKAALEKLRLELTKMGVDWRKIGPQ